MVVSIAGGLLPNVIKFTPKLAQLFMAFVSGFMVSIAILHLFPHGLEQVATVHPDSAGLLGALGLLLGVVVMFGILHILNTHDRRSEKLSDDNNARNRSVHVTWITVAVGLGIDSVLEGIALGSSIGLEYGVEVGLHDLNQPPAPTLTVAVLLAIILHKPLDALTVLGIMKHAGVRDKSRWNMNVGFAIVGPIAALLTLFFLHEVLYEFDHILGIVLTFIAGAFLCIALVDLLPEAVRDRRDRFNVFAAFLGGVLLILLFGLIASPM